MSPLSLVSGIWGYVGIGVVAAGLSVAGTHYVDANVYGNQIKDLKLGYAVTQINNANTALDLLTGRISKINSASVDYENGRKLLSDKLDQIHRDFLNAIKKTPLPPDCKPDAERVRSLESSVDAANQGYSQAERGFGETVRSTPQAVNP